MVLKNILHIAQHVFKTLINFSKHVRENTENCDTDCLCQIAISVPLSFQSVLRELKTEGKKLLQTEPNLFSSEFRDNKLN